MKTADICCSGDCREGRDCPLSAEATRRALRLTHIRDGGHVVEDGNATACEAPPRIGWWIAGAAFSLAIWTLVWALVRAFAR